jgi:hypothetical protein
VGPHAKADDEGVVGSDVAAAILAASEGGILPPRFQIRSEESGAGLVVCKQKKNSQYSLTILRQRQFELQSFP